MEEQGGVFETLADPRAGNAGKHSLHDILVIALCTVLCGGETCTDMALFGQSKREFLESFLPLKNGIPSHDTFSRVFRLLDPEAFQGKITASRQEGGHSSVESRYYLLSQAFLPERFNQIARAHWGIGNSLHWVLDVVFNEDQCRNRKDNCPDNLALLRKLALNLAHMDPCKGSIRGKLKRAGWDNDYLAAILTQFTKIQMR